MINNNKNTAELDTAQNDVEQLETRLIELFEMRKGDGIKQLVADRLGIEIEKPEHLPSERWTNMVADLENVVWHSITMEIETIDEQIKEASDREQKKAGMPDGLTYWTADEVAECLPYLEDSLRQRLWEIASKAENPTPIGGDGSSGTVETPDGRLDIDNDDKAIQWWGRLTRWEQEAICKAYDDDHKELEGWEA